MEVHENSIFFNNKFILPIVVFLTGAGVLVVEVLATRILSPYYGNTIFTFSSVISVILAALGFGYYVGGKISDKYPSFHFFSSIIFFSGIMLLLFNLLGNFLLPVLGKLSISTGPLVSSFVLFFLPAFLIGTLSPFAVKLQSIYNPKIGVGSVAGSIFFWSTFGSITGSLIAGFYLIPSFGMNAIMVGVGLGLSLLGLILYLVSGGKSRIFSRIVIILVVSIFSLAIVDVNKGSAFYVQEGLYQKISLSDKRGFNGRTARILNLDISSSGGMFLDTTNPDDFFHDYAKFYGLYKTFDVDVKNSMVIGGGAYSLPKAFLRAFPEARVDVSEIEPLLYELSEKYFDLPKSDRLFNYTDDGRRLLKQSDGEYDLIFSDVYKTLYSIPVHFTTVEFFQSVKDKLAEDGIFVANMIGSLDQSKKSFLLSEIKTFQTIFPNSYFFAIGSPLSDDTQNIIFAGVNSEKEFDVFSKSLITPASVIDLSNHLIDIDKFDLSDQLILTDNYAPVEYLSGQLLKESFD